MAKLAGWLRMEVPLPIMAVFYYYFHFGHIWRSSYPVG